VAAPQTVRAAAVQLAPVLGAGRAHRHDREGVRRRHHGGATRARSSWSSPETVVPYYPYFSFIQAPAAMGKEHLRLYEEAVTVPGADRRRRRGGGARGPAPSSC